MARTLILCLIAAVMSMTAAEAADAVLFQTEIDFDIDVQPTYWRSSPTKGIEDVGAKELLDIYTTAYNIVVGK